MPTEDQPITFHSHKVTTPPHPPNNAQPVCSHRTRLYQRLDSYAFLERIFWRGVIRLRVAVARTVSACGTDTRRWWYWHHLCCWSSFSFLSFWILLVWRSIWITALPRRIPAAADLLRWDRFRSASAPMSLQSSSSVNSPESQLILCWDNGRSGAHPLG